MVVARLHTEPSHVGRAAERPPVDPVTAAAEGCSVLAREPGQERLLTPGARWPSWPALHRRFEAARQARLAARRQRQAVFDAGALPDFRADTAAIRDGDWRVGADPARRCSTAASRSPARSTRRWSSTR